VDPQPKTPILHAPEPWIDAARPVIATVSNQPRPRLGRCLDADHTGVWNSLRDREADGTRSGAKVNGNGRRLRVTPQWVLAHCIRGEFGKPFRFWPWDEDARANREIHPEERSASGDVLQRFAPAPSLKSCEYARRGLIIHAAPHEGCNLDIAAAHSEHCREQQIRFDAGRGESSLPKPRAGTRPKLLDGWHRAILPARSRGFVDASVA